jgi:hypothetical protein
MGADWLTISSEDVPEHVITARVLLIVFESQL